MKPDASAVPVQPCIVSAAAPSAPFPAKTATAGAVSFFDNEVGT